MSVAILEKNKFSLLALTAIPILVFIIYGQTIQFSYNIDDAYYLNQLPERNGTFKEIILSINHPFNETDFRPVTYTTFLVEYLIFGKSPKIFHLFNLIYYSILCLTIFYVLQTLFKESKIRLASTLALLIALLFLVHPSHSNVVSSIKNRESILSLCLALWALYIWFIFLRKTKPHKYFYFVLSIFVLFLAIYAKIDSLVFLLIIPITSYFIYNYSFSWKKALKILTTVFLLFFIVLTLKPKINDIPTYQKDNISTVTFDENPIDFSTTLVSRWAESFHTFFMYEKFMVWPKEYYFYFGYDTIELWSYKDIWPYIFGFIHLILAYYVIILFRKRNLLALGPLIFFIGIFPFINLYISVAGIIAVRYSFIASLGFCIIAGHLLILLFEKLKYKNKLTPITFLIALSLIVTFGYFSHKRTKVWKDKFTLYTNDLPFLKRSVVANRMASTYYLDKYINDKNWKNKNTLLKVIEHTDYALEIYDKETKIIQTKAKALGFLNQHDEAHDLLRKSVEIDSTEIRGLSLLASHSAFLKKNEEAIWAYQRILEIDSSQTKPYTELSILYSLEGEFELAKQLNEYLFKNQQFSNAYLNLGNIELVKGDTLKAVNYFIDVLRSNESDNLKNIYDMVSEYADEKNNDSLKSVLKDFKF